MKMQLLFRLEIMLFYDINSIPLHGTQLIVFIETCYESCIYIFLRVSPISLYHQVTIVIKYFFQFGFFPFNQNIELDMSKPFHPPNIIGVEKKEGYVHYDLVQLLALFFHRSILKVPTKSLATWLFLSGSSLFSKINTTFKKWTTPLTTLLIVTYYLY